MENKINYKLAVEKIDLLYAKIKKRKEQQEKSMTKYRVELRKNDNIIIFKEFLMFDEAYNYSESLIKKLEKEKMILMFEKKEEKWKEFRKLILED